MDRLTNNNSVWGRKVLWFYKMTVFGICMAKNEEDIIGPVVEHMMSEVDHVIVADNLSQDNTRSILDSLTGNITVIDDLEPAYRQSEKMTHLAMVAKKKVLNGWCHSMQTNGGEVPTVGLPM